LAQVGSKLNVSSSKEQQTFQERKGSAENDPEPTFPFDDIDRALFAPQALTPGQADA